jgi:hypothetical protein
LLSGVDRCTSQQYDAVAQRFTFTMAPRFSISLSDEVVAQLRNTKPSHRPMSQHIVDLVVEAMISRKNSELRRTAIKDGNAAIVDHN